MPTPVYIVKYNGQQLPGYLTNEDVPLNQSAYNIKVLGRDGGFLGDRGSDFRNVNLTFVALSRLSVNSTGLQHLNDCKNQWRDALAIVARTSGSSQLFIGETDRFINATFVGSTEPLEAPSSRRISYTLNFMGESWFNSINTSSSSKAISGDDAISYAPGDSRKTYPIFTVPSGITHITISDDASDRYFTLSGSHLNDWVVNCGDLTITEGGSNAISALASGPDFGMYYQGSGSFSVSITEVAGNDTVSVSITPRYER